MTIGLMAGSASTRGGGNPLGNRRLREASRYVTRPWLPPSPVVLKRLQEKFKSGEPLKSTDLHQELTADFALFSQCIRRLAAPLQDKGSIDTPAALLRNAPVEKLREILMAPLGDWTTHTIGGVKDVQLSRVRHSVISCSAVEVLAKSSSCFDPDIAIGCSLIRELGFLLVVWNYPSSYLRARSQVEGGGAAALSFDEELEKLLGFAPAQLGYEMAGNWCRDPLFQKGFPALPSQRLRGEEPDSQLVEDGQVLQEFLKAAEVLAKINDPLLFPNASKEWDAAAETLKRYLGPTGIKQIRERIDERYPHYVALSAELFPDDLSPESAARTINVQYSRKLLEENIYVRRCPPELNLAFTEMYEGVKQGAASVAALNSLVGRVIPIAGFFSGCVYLLDPTKMVLVPKLLIGNARDRNFKTISCSCGGARSHPVSEAFHCTTPIKEEGAILNGDVVSHITGRFGTGDKMGVLYLEFKGEFDELMNSDDRLVYFKAIRHGLTDVLSMRSAN